MKVSIIEHEERNNGVLTVPHLFDGGIGDFPGMGCRALGGAHRPLDKVNRLLLFSSPLPLFLSP